MADPQVNFFSSTLVGGYSDSDTSLTLATGSGANLPDPSVDGEFNLVIYNESEIFVTTTFDGGSTDTRQDLASTNPEIVRVTARSGDVLTVTRAQEGTTASAKAAENTYRVILASTKKVFDDINTAIANVNVTNLTGVEELTFDSTGDEEFGLPAGTTAQRPSSPSAGYMRFNTDTTRVEVYDGSNFRQIDYFSNDVSLGVAELSVTANDATAVSIQELEYLVIAGGGGGGYYSGGGGGAGGYRSSVSGESSGGGASAESTLVFGTDISTSTNYTVTVGAGGAGAVQSGSNDDGDNGSNSVFNTITSTGGGGGGSARLLSTRSASGNNGGSGGGVGEDYRDDGLGGGDGTANQGFDGGDTLTFISAGPGGGGGAGQIGQDFSGSQSGDGGDGVSSSITGSAVTRAGGGGGGGDSEPSRLYTFGSGGAGGGGNGGNADDGENGTANTGGGGGGAAYENVFPSTKNGGSGGSGVVILRYPSSLSITIGAGLTASTSTVGANKVTTFTAGTGNVSWTQA